MLDEIKNINTSNKDIRGFGIAIGIILFTLSGVLFYYDKSYFEFIAFVGGLLVALGIIIPILLKPIYVIWMTFAIILGWIMTKLILILVFFFILTPIGLIARMLGEDFLGLSNVKSESYWNYRDSDYETNQDYEKQF